MAKPRGVNGEREFFEQLVMLLELEGVPVTQEMIHAMEPLLSGEMTPEEHREYIRQNF